jgi:arylsulfatase A-like enzyme
MTTRRELLAAAPFLAQSTKQPPRKPNLILLYTDDHRFDCLSCFPHPDVKTPNLDQLARQGTHYTHVFTQGGLQGAICVPSRAMVMTGRSLFHANESVIAPSAKATPYHFAGEALAAQGYSTFHTGKWHLNPRLMNRAFQKADHIFFGGMDTHLGQKMARFDPEGTYPAAARLPNPRFSSEVYADTALDFMANAKSPYFLNVAFTSPHDPRMAPEAFARMYDPAKIQLPRNFMPMHPFDNGELKVRDELLAAHPRTEAEVRRHIAAYYAMISEVDAQIGRILAKVDFGNTYVLFCGDNGLAVGQHGLMGKQNPYDHSWRVPCILAGPGITRGKRDSQLRHHFDLNATLYQMAQVPRPATVESAPMVDAKGHPTKGRPHVFLAYRHFQRAIRTDRWKYVAYNVEGKQTTRLYDMQNDPLEMNPVLDPKRESAMRTLLRTEMERLDDPLAATFLPQPG